MCFGTFIIHSWNSYDVVNDSKPVLLLGHVSMLLAMVIFNVSFFQTMTLDYIITCDRDEKIRVSHYPQAFDIQSFCLGHEE
jgi:tRNA (guanine-N(7)-)-methyltransferase subunit TRM82